MSFAGMVRFMLSSLRGGRMLNVGDEAPDFEVLDHHGSKLALHDLRGRKVVLWFYPKADTPG
jgi:peroxiredoxin Q/BCP